MSTFNTVRASLISGVAVLGFSNAAFAGSSNDIVGFTNVDVTNPVRGAKYDNNKFFIMDGNQGDYASYDTTCGEKAIVGYEGYSGGKLVGFAIGVPMPRAADSNDESETDAFGSAKVGVNAGVYQTGPAVNPNYLGNIWSQNVEEIRMNLPNDTSCIGGGSSSNTPVTPGGPGPTPPPPPPPPSGGCDCSGSALDTLRKNAVFARGLNGPQMA